MYLNKLSSVSESKMKGVSCHAVIIMPSSVRRTSKENISSSIFLSLTFIQYYYYVICLFECIWNFKYFPLVSFILFTIIILYLIM